MSTEQMPRVASDEELPRLLALIEDSDSVELKLTVPAHDQRAAVTALGLDPLQAQIRQVFFFDTPDLALNQRGLVVRARRVQKRGDDSVVKLRPVVPSELPDDIRKSPRFFVEVDAMPGGFVCSGAMKAELGTDEPVRNALAAKRPIRKLFSKEQRALYAAHAPEGLALEDLTPLGPIFVLKLKWAPKELARRVVAEMWLYPDNEVILELSTKCLPHQAFQVAAETRAYLSGRGIDLAGEQQTKTRKALEIFSRALTPAPA
jgi:hypothetical protein